MSKRYDIQAHLKILGIVPISIINEEREIVQLIFSKDSGKQHIIKLHHGAWSSKLKCWYLPKNKSLLVKLVKALAKDVGHCIEPIEIIELRRVARLKGYSPLTEKTYAEALQQALDYFGAYKPEDWTKRNIEDYRILSRVPKEILILISVNIDMRKRNSFKSVR